MKVFIYWNLHKKCWSIKSVETGLVVGWGQKFTLTNAEFKVSEAGRQRVLRERRKNVHAGVMGILEKTGFIGNKRARYNPYLMETFQVDGEPIYNASNVEFRENGTAWI